MGVIFPLRTASSRSCIASDSVILSPRMSMLMHCCSLMGRSFFICAFQRRQGSPVFCAADWAGPPVPLLAAPVPRGAGRADRGRTFAQNLFEFTQITHRLRDDFPLFLS